MNESMRKVDSQQSGPPWLEYFPEGGGGIHRVTLENGTLTIGRADTADIQIDSTRVSREHAKIQVRGKKTILSDLGSTNGTLVNGRVVEETELQAGDIILVADTELTYQTSATNRLRSMATQKLSCGPGDAPPIGETHSPRQEADDAILAMRRAHEALMRRYVPARLETIFEMPEQQPYAQLVAPTKWVNAPDDLNSPFLQPPLHVQLRIREAQRQNAAIQVGSSSTQPLRLVVPLEAWEIHEGDELLWHLVSLDLQLPLGSKLLASIRASDSVDLPDVEQFCHDLRAEGIGIACHRFMGSHTHVRELEKVHPDLLLLANELTSEPFANSRQQRGLSSVLEACEDLQILPVVVGPSSDKVVSGCSEIGYRLFTQTAIGGAIEFDVEHPESCKEAVAV